MIKGGKCMCGKKIVPFRNLCPACGGAMNEIEFDDAGSILTYTTLHAVPEGFEAPVRLAMVELNEGAHLLCAVKGARDMGIGDEVKVKMEGELYYCEYVK